MVLQLTSYHLQRFKGPVISYREGGGLHNGRGVGLFAMLKGGGGSSKRVQVALTENT